MRRLIFKNTKLLKILNFNNLDNIIVFEINFSKCSLVTYKKDDKIKLNLKVGGKNGIRKIKRAN